MLFNIKIDGNFHHFAIMLDETLFFLSICRKTQHLRKSQLPKALYICAISNFR